MPPTATPGLLRALKDLQPRLAPGYFVFAPVAGPPAHSSWAALVAEDEGLTCVMPQGAADEAGLAYDGVWAKITLGTRSALGLVGLTAAVSGALAEAGISCNVIAGCAHDHLFVPAERGEEALRALHDLADGRHPGTADQAQKGRSSCT